MHSIFSTVSVLEIISFCVGVFLFFSFPEDMAFIFIHTLHVVRGVLGLIITKKMPLSHDIVK